jgi:trafficking protein particle complex subunit 11
MLINEFYKISTTLTNNEASILENVKIIISLPTNLINKVFLVVDGETKPNTKLNSRIELNVGEMRESSNTTVFFYLMSMIEGNIELKQSICYEAENKTFTDESSKIIVTQVSSPTTETSKTAEKSFADKEDQHDIVVEYLDKNKLRKRRDDILIVPCVEEFHFESKFFTLNRQPATSLFKDEDFIMRCTLKMTSPFNIEIIDSFFLADVNVDEISNQNHKFVGRKEKLCMEIENLIILRPKNISSDFITNSMLEKMLNDDASKIFDEISVDKMKKDNPVSDVVKEIEDDPFALKNKDQKLNFVKNGEICKTIINDILSVTDLIAADDKRQGFINAKFNLVNEKNDSLQSTRFGVYCIKWKKIDSDFINESKFFVKAIDIRQPLLNIYTSPVDRVFVREVFTYKITLKNPHSSILNLKATFDSSCTDGFMFSGHRQLNISIFSHSSFELTFNLYPLKSDWQKLPELKLDLISHHDDGSPTNVDPITSKQSELNELLRRWLPKAIFVHVSKCCYITYYLKN